MNTFRCFINSVSMIFANVFCLFVLSIALMHGPCAAQSEEELKLLRMFYDEKDLFTSATHYAKPVSQIAENVTIVTSKQIEAMNAHSVADILYRVPGMFVYFNNGIGTVGSASLLRIQGSEERHVLVLVDGVPWNFLSGGSAETNTIPVGIIDRIEIIKGPASSAWGSALGGVVHILTKPAGRTKTPAVSAQASWGGMDTQDYSAQVSGRTGRLGYYVFGGSQHSDGPGGSRGFDNDSFYSKITYDANDDLNFEISMGVSQPSLGLGEFNASNIRSSGDNRDFWGTAKVDADITKSLTFNLSIYRVDQKSDITMNALGQGYMVAAGDLYQKSAFNESNIGGSAQLVWKQHGQTAVIGVEFKHGELDQTIYSGALLQQLYGAPDRLYTSPAVDNKAIYFNDTLVLGRLSITPGIRYDNSSLTDDFISPSLGLAYRLGRETILRGSIARGFTAPPLSWSSGGSFLLDPNSSLTNEKAWSYQVGLESAALRYIWIKTTLFRHDVEDVFTRELYAAGPPSYNDIVVNGGSSKRKGFEIEAETVPLGHLTLRTGFSFVNIDPANETGADNIYTHTIGITYDAPEILRAELFGYYICWDATELPDAEYGDFIWDLYLSKNVYQQGKTAVELFFNAHNIFNGSQYLLTDSPNPDRWIEAGVKLKF